jgi:very-short-patch-repair endonuclease
LDLTPGAFNLFYVRPVKRMKAPSLLWERLRRNGLQGDSFSVSASHSGLYRGFYCQKAGLIVEIDGKIHDFRKAENLFRNYSW